MTSCQLTESPVSDHRAPSLLPTGRRALKLRLKAANIHPESFLATDYLNHFNEVVMLLEMAADMPDMLEDVGDWAPKSYEAHFEDSGFAEKALAIEAYRLAPEPIRARFDLLVEGLDRLVLNTMETALSHRLHPESLARALAEPLAEIRAMLGALNGVIHGAPADDDAIGDQSDASAADKGGASQADIDALFD